MIRARGLLIVVGAGAIATACATESSSPTTRSSGAPASRLLVACHDVPPGALHVQEVAPSFCAFAPGPDTPNAALAAALTPHFRATQSAPAATTANAAPPGARVGQGYARQLGLRGKGVVVGIVDSGVDFQHPDLKGPDGSTRVKWLLDYTAPPAGKHADLEARFGSGDGPDRSGAVLSDEDLGDPAIAAGVARDNVGHGSHVAGIAASSDATFEGVAPEADVVGVALGNDNGEITQGIRFVFDRADALGEPAVVNLSLGATLTTHDGRTAFDQAITAVLHEKPRGHVIVVAAGNDGNVRTLHDSVLLLPNQESTSALDVAQAGAQVSILVEGTRDLQIGLEGPDGGLLLHLDGLGAVRENHIGDFFANLVFDPAQTMGLVSPGSTAGIVVLRGQTPPGRYHVLLQGQGRALLTLEGAATFVNGTTVSSVDSPGTSPDLITVGATYTADSWHAKSGATYTLHTTPLATEIPDLNRDGPPAPGGTPGVIWYFSGAGPLLDGSMKPDVLAPGGPTVSSVSALAATGGPSSVFAPALCGGIVPAGAPPDPGCTKVDDQHGVLWGTSQATPFAAGVVALLLQRDPSLDEARVKALLRAGAHRWVGPRPPSEYGADGEIDIERVLQAQDAAAGGMAPVLPTRRGSWVAVSRDVTSPVDTVEVDAVLRDDSAAIADGFDASRLQVRVVTSEGVTIPSAPLAHDAPGLFRSSFTPAGVALGTALHVSVQVDGADVTDTKTVLVMGDVADEASPPRVASAGCAIAKAPPASRGGAAALAFLLLSYAARAARRITRRRGRSASASRPLRRPG